MKTMLASYLIFILKVVAVKKQKELNELMDINMKYLEKSTLSLEDCREHAICFYKLYYHPEIYPSILKGDVIKPKETQSKVKVDRFDIEKLNLTREVVCYDKNITNTYKLRGEPIINSITTLENKKINLNTNVVIYNRKNVVNVANSSAVDEMDADVDEMDADADEMDADADKMDADDLFEMKREKFEDLLKKIMQ